MTTKKAIHTSGRRKKSVARVTLHPGTGKVRVNSVNIEVFGSDLVRARIMEPLILAEEMTNKVDLNVNIIGGGIMSGADAARLAIAKALVEFSGKESFKQQFLDYDRSLLVADVRFKEACKPNISKARAKRQKSYR